MCGKCHSNHPEEFINGFELPDISAVSLLLINTLIESYVEDNYCDPILYKALKTARQLAARFVAIVEENSDDEELLLGVRDIVEKIDLTLIRAGETINTIIEEHDLPVMKNTFEIDLTHPKAKKRMKKGKK